MDFVFEAKEKKMNVNLYGEKYTMRVPKISEYNEISEKIKSADPKDVVSIYFDFFVSLGLPREALDKFDAVDFQEFVSFVLFPKKNN